MADGPTAPRLGVIELSTHENFLADFCRIAADRFRLTVFTTEDIHRRISDDLASDTKISEWIIQESDEGRWSFLDRVEFATRHLDALWAFPFYGNVIDFARYARFEPDCPFVLSLYDTNGWIGRSLTPTPKVYNYIKYPLKRWILRRVDAIAVEYEPIELYLESALNGIPVETFSPVQYDPMTQESPDETERLVCTIPGMIDTSRRNYSVVRDAIGQLSQPQKATLEVVLLGRPIGPDGEAVVSAIGDLQTEGLSLRTFEGWIETAAFKRELVRSDILLSPLKRTRQVDGFTEQYGRTKGSGVLGDGIRYATPLVLPDWYQVPDQLRSATRKYASGGELAEVLAALTESDDALQTLRSGAGDAAQYYTKRQQADRLEQILTHARSSMDRNGR